MWCSWVCKVDKAERRRAEKRLQRVDELIKTVQSIDKPKPGLDGSVFCTANLDLGGAVLTDRDFGV